MHKSKRMKKAPTPIDYPEETEGSQAARRLREEANNLSETQREALFKKGMQVIYGGNGHKEKAGIRH